MRQTVVVGVLLLFPAAATVIILQFLLLTIDGVLGPAITWAIGRSIPGLGLVGLLILVYATGLLGRSIVGRRLVDTAHRAFQRTPLFGALYAPAKQLIESFSGGTDTGFKRVVMIQHPRPGVWIIGFLTGATHYDADTRLAGIYTPTAPTPNSGWVVLVPAADVHDVDLTVPAAMRTILSGGILTPPGVRRVESC